MPARNSNTCLSRTPRTQCIGRIRSGSSTSCGHGRSSFQTSVATFLWHFYRTTRFAQAQERNCSEAQRNRRKSSLDIRWSYTFAIAALCGLALNH